MSNKTKLEEVENQKPGGYTKSDAVLAAEQALADYNKAKPGEYQSNYTAQLDSILKQITERPQFSYDSASDPLYAQYKASYTRGGKQAAENAAAQASALSGGYANSYAATAAAQANEAYMAKLNDVLPELYDTAMSRYQLQGKTLSDQYGAVQSADKNAYNKYRDQVGDWYDYLDYLSGAADTAYKKDYGEYGDSYDAWQDWRDYYATESQRDTENELARQKFEQAQREWQAEYDLQQQKWQAEQAAAAAQAAAASVQSSTAKASSGGSKKAASSTANDGQKASNASALSLTGKFKAQGRSDSYIYTMLARAGYNQTAIEYALAKS